jgi:hypothetical protein
MRFDTTNQTKTFSPSAAARGAGLLGALSMRVTTLLVALPLLAALCPAQHTILLTGGASDESTLALDAPEVDLITAAEIYQINPVVGVAYSAVPFLPIGLVAHFMNDLDGDGLYFDQSPGDIDEIFVKAGTVGPVSPRDVFVSLTTASTPMATAASDVFRYAANGVREVFVTEVELRNATGITQAMNLDALCQTIGGDLFFSVADTETAHFGSIADGDLLFIPASAIAYDGAGNVTSMGVNSAARVATETQVIAMITNSGFKQASGSGAPSAALFELSGLEVDPAGGTWVSPVDTLNYPNLLFTWRDSSNDGAIISTSGSGSLAVINGVTMGSTVGTFGNQLGWTPTATGTSGPGGLALVPVQAPKFEMLTYPRSLHTPGTSPGQTWMQFQTSGGVPNGLTIIIWSVETPVPGGAFPSFPAPAPLIGEFGLSGLLIQGAYFNDARGNCISDGITLATHGVMSGLNLAAQAVDFPSFVLSTPVGLSFL